MTPDEFRRGGHELVDWVADYLERSTSCPVRSADRAGLGPRPAAAASAGSRRAWTTILADLDRVIVPGITHWQSPHFFAYFPANASGPSILGDLVSSGLGVQGMLWATSPACTELETHVLDWLVELLGLPRRFRSDGAGGGVIQDSASSANLCAIARRPRPSTPADVGARRGSRAYTSTQAHSSVERRSASPACSAEQLRLVDVDDDLRHATRPPAAAIAADVAAGLVPFLVVGDGRHDVVARRRPGRRRSPTCATPRHVAPRRRRHGRVRRRRARAAAARERRPRARRQLVLRPAQVAAHQLRLRRAVRRRPRAADPVAQRPARVPAQRGQRVGRGHRLPRLARPARPPVPGAQAVVRAARTTAPRACARTSPKGVASARWLAAADRRRRALRTGRAGRPVASCASHTRRRRRDARCIARRGQRRPAALTSTHTRLGRPLRHPCRGRAARTPNKPTSNDCG